jgi:hypothetical protein
MIAGTHPEGIRLLHFRRLPAVAKPNAIEVHAIPLASHLARRKRSILGKQVECAEVDERLDGRLGQFVQER